ncbi:phosphatase inhibitor-domain-containing protein [Phlebopus sp. FC_14]|nr:phosphatase inhibitor-domain-containing protein [Phlebopus sp. FC_14]
MNAPTQQRAYNSVPTDGSRTITLRDSQPRPEDDVGPSGESTTVGALRLRGAPRRTRQRVAWGEDVIDNEGCGKKKSKICCIYHKPRRFDESSSESDSDSDSDSSCGHGHTHDRASARSRGQNHPPNGRDHDLLHRDGAGGAVHELHDSDDNAYERAPKGRRT